MSKSETTRPRHVLRRLRMAVDMLQVHREMGSYDGDGRYIAVVDTEWWQGLSGRDRSRVLKEANRHG